MSQPTNAPADTTAKMMRPMIGGVSMIGPCSKCEVGPGPDSTRRTSGTDPPDRLVAPVSSSLVSTLEPSNFAISSAIPTTMAHRRPRQCVARLVPRPRVHQNQLASARTAPSSRPVLAQRGEVAERLVATANRLAIPACRLLYWGGG